MKPGQFSIRHLFVAVLVVSTSIVVLQLLARYVPSIFVVTIVSSFAVGAFGLAIVVFAGILALSIYLNDDETDRPENLRRCTHLAGIGFLMTTPLLLAFFIVLFLPRS